MEFFVSAKVRINANELPRHVRIDTLPQLCPVIEAVLSRDGERGEVQGPWGPCRIHREVIRGGVRFSLPSSPYGLQWTVTTAGEGMVGEVQVHATTYTPSLPAEMQGMMEAFMAAWQAGLESGLAELIRAQAPRAGAACPPSFGGFG